MRLESRRIRDWGPGAGNCGAVLLAAIACLMPAELAAQATRPAPGLRRAVKHFDFDERALGNFESTPMYWRRRTDPGFSLFLEGQLDHQVYRSAAPSFRLDLDGGSLAYEYLGGDVVIHTPGEYMVTGWIRASGLETARAYITACFQDRKREVIPGSERRSSLIGGHGPAGDWCPVTIALPPSRPEARYISVSIWLVQESVWNIAPRPPRSVDREDVRATAWFDEITIFPCPAVVLSTPRSGQVFSGVPELSVRIANPDQDRINLSTLLTLTDAESRTIANRVVGLDGPGGVCDQIISFPELGAGLYQAQLLVNVDSLPLIRRDLSFLRLPDAAAALERPGGGFGVVLENTDLALLPAQMELIRHLGVEFVKLPLRTVPTEEMDLAAGSPGERYRQAMVNQQVKPIVMLQEPQTQPALEIGPSDSIAEKNPGNDASPIEKSDPQAGRRAGLAEVTVPAQVPVETIETYVAALIGPGREQAWINVEAPPPHGYARELRLADLARRIVEAAWHSPAGVFVMAPWSVCADGDVPRAALSEDYLVVRTAVRALGGASPVARMDLDGQARAILFDREGKSVLFAWDPHAPPEGRPYVLPLGEAVTHVDVRGQELPVGRAGRQRVVRLGPLPTFILDAPTWLIDFRRHFAVEPRVLQTTLEPARPTIRFRNASRQSITGTLRLVAPRGWELRPSRFTFALQPGEEFHQPVILRIPQNASAELTPLVGEFEVIGEQRQRFLVPAWFEVGLEGVEFDTYTHRSGDALLIGLHITNRTASPMEFEAHLLAPGRNRIVRPRVSFPPHQPMTETFPIEQADQLSGRPVRLSLKERNGTRAWNRVFTVP